MASASLWSALLSCSQLLIGIPYFFRASRMRKVVLPQQGEPESRKGRLGAAAPNSDPVKDVCYVDRFGCVMCDSCCLCSGKWLVGPSSTSNRATSFLISLGHTWRCYGVMMSRTDASDHRRTRFWLPFFRKAGRNSSCHERFQSMLARC